MGRKLFFGLMVLVFAATSASAASIGRVKTIGQGKYAVDEFNDVVLDRAVKAKTNSSSGSLSGDYALLSTSGATLASITTLSATYSDNETLQPDLDKVYTNGLGLTYGISDNLDIFVRFGVSDGKLKGGSYTTALTGTAADLTINGVSYGAITIAETLTFQQREELKQGLAYALGFKYTQPMDQGWLAGVDVLFFGQNNKFKNKVEYTLTGDFSGSGSYSEDGKGRLYEWHVAPYIAKEMGAFTPYAGVKYSQMSLRSNIDGEKTKFSADNNVGIFLGTDIDLGKSFVMNFEGRFVDETALSAKFTFKF